MPSSVGDSGELESVVLGTFFGFIDQSAASLSMHFVIPMTPRVISIPLLGSNGVRVEYKNALPRQGGITPPSQGASGGCQIQIRRPWRCWAC